ncbi:hypothetical protein GCM10027275_31560 [Rhabdobacter roseus]|uniref:Translocation and assembly module TamB C-terminal domain-containing protein n=1 Tax=Rhabdobacter roseus TaxID=1655419 RepID=A0A840TQD5_9BACT|nr:translocation/assembly module TamB domain-containing protein [Rhabdobacter roseus]MBB5285115.1 hypothetical protein [Rhabdobacter roseus]
MKKVVTVIAIIFLVIILLVGVLLWGIQTPAGQEFLTKQGTLYLRRKLGTRLDIEAIRFSFPDWVAIEGVYLEDTQGDTLVSGERLYVNLDMWGLVKGNVALNTIELEGMRAKINRTLPDTTFNFQFIIDAFASDTDTPADTTSEPLEMRLNELTLKRVHLTYRDAVIGTDADANINLAQVYFSKFNPTRSQYHPDRFVVNGARADLRLYEALVKTETPTTPAQPADPADTLDVKVGDLDIRNFNWTFVDEVGGLKNGLTLGRLAGHVDHTDLNNQRLDIRNLLLENTSTYVAFSQQPKKPEDEPTAAAADTASAGWNVRVGELKVAGVNLRYDDFNEPRQPKGLDFAHLDVQGLVVDMTGFVFAPDSIAGQLGRAAFREKSGFVLQELRTDFTYATQQTYLKNLYIKTPNTTIRDELVLRYRNQEQLTENIGQVQVRMRLTNSQVAFRDLLMLSPDLAEVPPFDKNPNASLQGSGLVTGTVNNLLLSNINFQTLNGTRLRLNGRIQGLPDTDRLAVDLSLDELSSTRSDLLSLAPADAIPASIELPERINLTGKIQGTLQDLTMDATLGTSLGNGSFNGNIKNSTNPSLATYNGTLSFQEFDMGTFLKQPPEEMGKITLSTDVNGQGFEPATMQARLNGTVQSASLKGYTYNNLALKGNIDKGLVDFEASLNDENVAVQLSANADISQEYPAVKADASIERLNLLALNLYEQDLRIQGNINVDMSSTNPENPLGSIVVQNFVLTQEGNPIAVDSLAINLRNVENGREATLESPFLKARLQGTFTYPELGDMVLTEVNKYFVVSDSVQAPTQPYDFEINARLAHHPVLQSFVPALTKLDTVRFDARVSSQADTSLRLDLVAPLIEYDTMRISNTTFNLSGVGTEANFTANVGELLSSGFRMRRASLEGDIINNDVIFNFVVKDSLDDNRHALAGHLAYNEGQYRFNLRDELLLDYQPWQTDSTGYIQYGADGLLVRNFSIGLEDQKFLINSTTDEPNGPIEIVADSIAIGPFVALVTQDTTLAAGKLNGDIIVRDYMESPSFTGDLVINDLAVTQIAIGDLTVKATNETADRISAEVTLLSRNNDMTITGDYLLDSEKPLDFTLNLKKLGAETIEAFSFGQLRRAQGSLSGQATIRGAATSPELNGAVSFDSVSFTVAQLGARYLINQRKIAFEGQKIVFNNFVVTDSLNQNLEVNGSVNIADLPDIAYDMNIEAHDFTVLNATRRENDFFYGKGLIDANLNIKGKGSESIIDGTIRLRPGSDITVILPDDAAGAEATEGVIQFVDMSNPGSMEQADSLAAAKAPTIEFASEMSLNIEADDKSKFTIIIDELNGDNLKVSGNAQLNTGIAPNGELYLVGLYELTEGSYDLTLEVLKRQFTIQKGSQLTWTGDPMKADVNITAVYTVQADPAALGQGGAQFGKVPFDVLLKMQGSLESPIISFDIRASEQLGREDIEQINTLLVQLQNNEAEMNKQVFALLVLNKFMTEQASSASSGGFSAEAVARQSVSQLLTEQLNLLAGGLVKGVDLNFNLNSTSDALAGNRTDLNVGLSKGFLNDRLTVSVGRNFELENSNTSAPGSTELFDNLAVNYALTRDNRYMLRAYRKNQYQAVLQGFIIETGVGFILTLDYDKIRELFQKQEQ